jgi:hypothetical protein
VTTLAADKIRVHHFAGSPVREEYPVIATDIVYRGAAVGENGSGYSRPLVAGDPFQGFAVAKADNASGAAGDKTVTVDQKGFITLPISGLAVTANDRPLVYASDDDTFTLTATSNSLIGTVSRWVSTGIAVVEFDAMWAAGMTAALAAAAA